MDTRSDKSVDLVRRIERGDEQAEAELVQRYAQGTKLILFKRAGDEQLANDLCQETMMTVIATLREGRLRNPASLKSFIRQTAINICNSYFRQDKRYVSAGEKTISHLVLPRDDKAQTLDKVQLGLAVETALRDLPVSRDREILRRFYLADEDKEQICADLHLSAAHFDRVLYRAKQRMRELMERNPQYRSILKETLKDE